MRVYAFFTKSTGRIGNMIARITIPKPFREDGPRHTGIAFEKGPNDWDCAEAHADDTGASKQAGFAGWFPLASIEDWVSEKEGRSAWKIHIPMSEDEAMALHFKTECHIGLHDYHVHQLVMMWGRARFGLPCIKNPAKVVCSEMVSRLLAGHIDIPKEVGKKGHDVLSPWDVQQALLAVCGTPKEALMITPKDTDQ